MRCRQRASQRGASIGLMLFGLIFFAAGASVILVFPFRGELQCGGEPAVCVLERGGLVTPEARSFVVADIASAEVKERLDDEGDLLSQPVLVLKSGAHEPLQGGWSNLGDPHGDAAKIRAWLAAPTGTLILSSGSGWFVMIFGSVFTLIGLFVMGLGWVQDGD